MVISADTTSTNKRLWFLNISTRVLVLYYQKYNDSSALGYLDKLLYDPRCISCLLLSDLLTEPECKYVCVCFRPAGLPQEQGRRCEPTADINISSSFSDSPPLGPPPPPSPVCSGLYKAGSCADTLINEDQ